MRLLDYILTRPGRRRLWWDFEGFTKGHVTFTYDGDLRTTSQRCNRSARKAYRFGYNDPHIFAWLETILQPGIVFFDVGANVGLYGLFVAKRIGEHGQVHAFEADLETAEFLTQNARANQLGNLTIVVAAVGDEEGVVSFSRAKSNRGASHVATGRETDQRPVPILTLDAYAERLGIAKIHLAKLDLEGFEAKALRGMTDLLKRSDECAILTEINADHLARYGSSLQDIRDLLEPLGYQAHRVLHNGLEPFDWTRPTNDALWLR